MSCSVANNCLNMKIRKISGNTSTTTTKNTTTTVQADCNIYSVPQNQISNISNYMYDEQTILYINSGSQNYTTGVYFDPTQVNGSWNYSLNNSNNLLAGQNAMTSLYDSNLQSYQNLQSFGVKNEGSYTIDITNGQQTTTNSNPLFYAIGASYTSQSSQYNTIPNYNPINTSSYLETASYMFTSQQNILVVKIVIKINSTDSLCVDGGTGKPLLLITVTNTVSSKESMKNGSTTAPKVYEHSMSLKYSNTSTFDNKKTCFYMNSPIPLIFAPGFNSTYSYISCLYIPPVINNSEYYGQYLPSNGYTFVNGINSFDTTTLEQTTQKTNYGYFIIAMAYQYSDSYSTYLTSGIQEEVITTNIWHSPISLYNSYKNYSVLDSNGLNVTLLFGKTYNGALFLVTNTGTPISAITAFGYTTLSNFINIMQAFCREYDNTSSLVNYYTDPYTIANLKLKGYNVSVVGLTPIIDAVSSIKNPSSINTLPNMNYLFIHQSNSVNITIDSSQQTVINQNTGQSYFGIANSSLYSLGSNLYTSSKLDFLSTANNTLFGNTISLGLQDIAGVMYYVNLITPESSFRPNYTADDSNTLSIYATLNTAYYVSSGGGNTRYIPGSIYTNQPNQPKYDITKLTMTVSNNPIF
jgi:hypothetical protein